MTRLALVALAALLLPVGGCVDPNSLDGLVIALGPSVPDNVNVQPIVLQRPSAERVRFRWTWERDGELYTENGPSEGIGGLGAWETLPGEEWTLTVTPVALGVQGPVATASTVIADAGRDSDNDQDGWTENAGDCDDTDARIQPFVDNDQDGFPACRSPFGDPTPADCDDFDARVHPEADRDDAALLDTDDDCDGLIDEDAHAAGDLAIVEVLGDPSVSDGGWIEIVALGGRAIELEGWRLGALGQTAETLPPARLEPGDRGLLCADPVVVPELTCLNDRPIGVALDGEGLAFHVEGRAIALFDPADKPAGAGASTQLSASAVVGSDDMEEPTMWCLATATWAAGTDLGSPGAANEVCP